MSGIDPRSLIFVAGLLSLVCAVILFVMRRSFPPAVAGLKEWAWGNVVIFGATPLFGLRDHLHPLFSVVLANGMLIGGEFLLVDALLRFSGRRAPWRLFLAILVLSGAAMAWYSLVIPDYPVRLRIVTAFNTLFFAWGARIAWTVPRGGFAGRFLAGTFAFASLTCLARFLTLMVGSDPGDLLVSDLAQQTYVAGYTLSVFLLTIAFILLANQNLRDLLEFQASHDSLTGAFARGAFLDLLGKEIERSRRHGRPLALLMLDLDHFKAVNDRHGHLVGDRVLREFARCVASLLRRPDVFGRYGGEEFTVMLPETPLEDALVVAERIRAAVAADQAPGLPACTVSQGVAEWRAGRDTDGLLADADAALYEAKRGGRDRVAVANLSLPGDGVSAGSGPAAR